MAGITQACVNADGTYRCESVNEHANFATFGTAMQTLVRVATGEFWNGLMHDYMDDGYPIALVFFFTFVVLVTFIMLNLIIGVLIINFLESSDEGAVQMDDIVDYRKAWAVLDPDDTGSIDVNDLPNLMKALDMPLGLHRPTEYAVLKHIPQIVLRQAISQVRNILPVVEGRVNIVETLFVLAWRQQEIEVSTRPCNTMWYPSTCAAIGFADVRAGTQMIVPPPPL